MLTLRIDPDAAPSWTWNGTSYLTRDGGNRVTPCGHPMTEQIAAARRSGTGGQGAQLAGGG